MSVGDADSPTEGPPPAALVAALPARDPLPEREAVLEAPWPPGRAELPPFAAVEGGDPAWAMALDAERRLANGEDGATLDAELAALALRLSSAAGATSEAREAQRRVGRVLAARARAQIEGGRDPAALLASAPVMAALPAWELAYLRGIAAWRAGERLVAEAALEAASGGEPARSCVALARATLLAGREPATARAMLASAAPSREVLVALAALCARLGDPAAAAEHLRRAAVAAGEPARHLWAGGRRAWGERAARLGVALDARVAGDAVPGGAARPLETARRAFGAARALARGNAADPRRRQELGRTVRAALGELGTGPLLGDALFFRALAALALAPDQAANDLRTLLARRAWIEREARAGSTRPQAVGDALLRLGQAAEAARSYRAARSPGVGERATAEREAVARVVQAIAEAKGPTEIGAAFTEAERGAPDSAWTATLAAFGLLAAGDPAAAAARLDEATARGAPSPVVAALAVLVESVRGGVALPPGVGAALRLPAVVATGLAFLAGVDGTEPEPLLQDLELKMTPALARRLLRHLCDQGRWPEARAHAARLAAVGEAWAGDLAALVRLRHALHLAASGDLDGADRELAAVDRATATYLSTQKGPP